ncbi:MAG: hypothetical protein QF442_03670 [Candidatus Peribacteraceae bacterium]|nr:hypothetical protein [Candidatus Peribacteraceae bacterium]
MNKNTHRHRHFVALPMALALVILSSADMYAETSDVLSSVTSMFGGETDQRYSSESGVYGVVYSGGEIVEEDTSVTLTKGSALLASKGGLTIDIGDARVFTFDGAVHITQGQSSFTVAAITAPALVSTGQQRMIIPIGMQWSFSSEGIATIADGFDLWMQDRMPKSLPLHFLERVLIELSGVRIPDALLPPEEHPLIIDTVSLSDLLLPVSRLNEEEDRSAYLIGVFRAAVEQGGIDRITELLEHEEVSAALKSPEGRRALLFLLSGVDTQNTALLMVLLRESIDDSSVWLVSSLHPAYRDIAWVLDEPSISVEAELTRAFLLPISALSPQPFSDLILERFKTTLLTMLDRVGDPESLVEYLLMVDMPLIDRLEERGYPRRAMYLADTLIDLIDAISKKTVKMEDAYAKLLARDQLDISPLPPKREFEEVSPLPKKKEPEPEPEVTLTPEQVEGAAYRMLEDAEALFTVNTGIAAVSGNSARVTDILFSAATEDRSVTFTLNVVTRKVSDIVINGQSDFPYEPSFAAFVTWVRK